MKESTKLAIITLLVGFIFVSVPIVRGQEERSFEMVREQPVERIVKMGEIEDFEITVLNYRDVTDSYEFTTEITMSEGVEEKWNVEVRNPQLEGVEAGQSVKNVISVEVPENTVANSEGVVNIICTNSEGKVATGELLVGAEPPSEYNWSYVFTGIAVVIIGVLIAVVRAIGLI